MKNIVKQLLVLVMLVAAVPAIAAEGPTKGTKSYQNARSENPAQPQTDAQASAEDVSEIAPAAGDTSEAQEPGEQVKTMREEMRLPRKN